VRESDVLGWTCSVFISSILGFDGLGWRYPISISGFLVDFAHQAGGVQALLVFHLLLILWDYLTIQILEPFSRLFSVNMVVIILNRYNIPTHMTKSWSSSTPTPSIPQHKPPSTPKTHRVGPAWAESKVDAEEYSTPCCHLNPSSRILCFPASVAITWTNSASALDQVLSAAVRRRLIALMKPVCSER
jgi:hypothetical protein